MDLQERLAEKAFNKELNTSIEKLRLEYYEASPSRKIEIMAQLKELWTLYWKQPNKE
jgi:hypothetical protein